MKTIIWIILGVAVLALLGWWIFSLFNAGPDYSNVPENGALTIEGTIVCLPHKDDEGPQTLECAYGLQGQDGNYYGLTGGGVSGTVTQFPTDTDVEVAGVFTREEDDRYATVGVIMVDRITEVGAPETGSEISDGVIIFGEPENFGLAVTNEQVLATSTVPSCTNEFSYCLYYNGTEYENTNFDSAGLSIRKRTDLTTENACLETQPAGYTDLESSTSSGSGYSMSLFAPLDDAAAGHYSTGEDYRLFASSTCYQFITRIGEAQFANMATGTVEFTDAQRTSLLDTLRNMVGNIRLALTGNQLTLPAEIE